MVKFFLKEEWKGKYAVMGVFIHIFTAVLIAYLSMGEMDKSHYAAVFWIVVIFTTLQGIARGFILMRKGSFAYWHQLCSPEQFLATRLVISGVLMMIFSLFAFLLFFVINGGQDMNLLQFLLVILLTGMGISFIFTVGSSIAAKTDHPGVLLPVLTFPVIFPLALIGVRAGLKVVDDLGFSVILPELCVLLLLDILVVVMGLFLVKFVWKE